VNVSPFFLIFLCLFNFYTSAQIYPMPERIPREDLGIIQQSNEKLSWLMDAKFGMFLHWGLYSGAENGEWYMNWAGIPINEYRKFAYPDSGDKQFTADRFNPDEWAQLAKDAGMKYMNLTTMHHDGFALFFSVIWFSNTRIIPFVILETIQIYSFYHCFSTMRIMNIVPGFPFNINPWRICGKPYTYS